MKLKAENEGERDEWVIALRKVVEQYKAVSQINGASLPMLRQPNAGIHKHLTLNQISDSLLQYKDQVGVRVQGQEQAFKIFKFELLKLSDQIVDAPLKDQLVKILKAASDWQDAQKRDFEFLSLTSKNLYTMVESIAEKEIQKDPIEFIKRENF